MTTAGIPDVAEKGRRIFEQAVKGRWEEVRADFDDRMLAGLDAKTGRENVLARR
jgi:hypothetical protein